LNIQPHLRWQCRRGMRELDELLLRYLEKRYPDASRDEKIAFREILELSDPELNSFFLQKRIPNDFSKACVVNHILNLESE
tara:strand:- start:261 stop:503 length:243 start_codon:yes stop_codon:yes gene_type:complete